MMKKLIAIAVFSFIMMGPAQIGNVYANSVSDQSSFSIAGKGVDPDEAVFIVYPNPCDTWFAVGIVGYTATFKVEVYNSAGQLVVEKEGVHNDEHIDITNLPAGGYTVKVTTLGFIVPNYTDKMLVI